MKRSKEPELFSYHLQGREWKVALVMASNCLQIKLTKRWLLQSKVIGIVPIPFDKVEGFMAALEYFLVQQEIERRK